MMHRHRVYKIEDFGFSGPIYPARKQNPAAHGGIREIWYCKCGAERHVNVNMGQREEGDWHMPVMRLTKQQLLDLGNAAKPLQDWLAENCHPHVVAHVEVERLEVLESIGLTVNRRPVRLKQ